MNEQLQTKLVEILASIQAATKTAGDFALEQLPDIAMQYVLYGRVQTTVMTALALLMAALMFSIFRWAYINQRDNEVAQGAMIFSCAFGFAFAMIGVSNFDFMVWLAPKVWLMKEFASMVR